MEARRRRKVLMGSLNSIKVNIYQELRKSEQKKCLNYGRRELKSNDGLTLRAELLRIVLM